MKYMMLIYSDEGAWEEGQRTQCYHDSARLARDLHASGKYLGASPLHSVATATSVRMRDGKRVVTDGPFAEAKEQIGGFWVIEAKDLDDALDWASQATIACRGPVEVRPFQDEEA